MKEMAYLAMLVTSVAASEAVKEVHSFMNENGKRIKALKESEWGNKVTSGEWPRLDLERSFTPATCNNTETESGFVDINGELFPCNNVDFLSFIPLSDLFLEIQGGTTQSSDIWGWEDPVTRNEITIHCVDNGVWYIDNTDPAFPIRIGHTSNPTSKYSWCDVKVYKDTAYVVKDRSSETEFDETYGIQVIDLNRLREVDEADMPIEFEPDYVYDGHGQAHNVAVDTESGFLYTMGGATCRGGLHMLDLADPLRPEFVGCVDSDGYVHDTQCVVYTGPDTRFTDHQICFGYNEDSLTIFDVTNKSDVIRLSRTPYENRDYTHQGWLTDDMKYVILNDEGDETAGIVNTTTSYIADVSDLRVPQFVSTFTHSDESVDHNLYFWGAIHKRGWGGSPAYDEDVWNFPAISTRYAYLSNYIAGLRILDTQGFPTATEAGFFDCAPDLVGGNLFEGTWSNYMHPSGTIALSSIDRGLFFVRFRDTYTELIQTDSPTIVPTTPTFTDSPTVLPTSQPTVCFDMVPTGLTFTATGLPAECVNITSLCTLEIVYERCPVSCGLCIPSPTFSPTISPTPEPTGSPTVEAETEDDILGVDTEDILLGAVVFLSAMVLVLLWKLCSATTSTLQTETKGELL